MDCVFNSVGTCDVCGRTLGEEFRHAKRQCVGPRTQQATTPRIARLTPTLYLHTCPRCDWQLETETNEPVEHVCGSKKITRLGDRIEHALESVGITKEKYVGWKERFGLPPTCSCESRKRFLNKIGDELGDAARSAVEKSLSFWRG